MNSTKKTGIKSTNYLDAQTYTNAVFTNKILTFSLNHTYNRKY